MATINVKPTKDRIPSILIRLVVAYKYIGLFRKMLEFEVYSYSSIDLAAYLQVINPLVLTYLKLESGINSCNFARFRCE